MYVWIQCAIVFLCSIIFIFMNKLQISHPIINFNVDKVFRLVSQCGNCSQVKKKVTHFWSLIPLIPNEDPDDEVKTKCQRYINDNK
jgi:hypothetical protein